MSNCHSIIIAIPLLTVLCAIAYGAATGGQKETDKHGAMPPSYTINKHLEEGKDDQDFDHQAILGSKKDAEEFDQLPAEESKKRLLVLAQKMDIDGDGYVNKTELTAWIYESMQSLDREEVEERFSDIDRDGDGLISWQEYAEDAFGDEDAENKVSTETDDVKLMQEDSKYFKEADLNKDGKLDSAEFAAFQNPETHEHMHAVLIEATLQEKDTDRNGFIDFTEFMGDIGDNPESEWYTVEKERFEQDYDKNKDGVLDREEMKAWLIPDTRQTATDETEHLFGQADKDKDSRLTYDEIVDEYKLFVGSEATNYGEHLESIKDEL